MQTACFLRDEQCMQEVAGTIAAYIRQAFRSSVKAELQLSLAALPWPVREPRESQSQPTDDSLNVRAAFHHVVTQSYRPPQAPCRPLMLTTHHR